MSKKVYLVYGPPSSGKTTYINKHATGNDLIVDMDLIYAGISNNHLYHKPRAFLLEERMKAVKTKLIAEYVAQADDLYSVQMVCMDSYRYELLKDALAKYGISAEKKNIKLYRPSDVMRTAPLIERYFANKLLVWDDTPHLRWATNNTKIVPTKKSVLANDDEDEMESEYRRLYGDRVIQFCKEEWMKKTDTIDNLQKHSAVVYARNAMNDIAKSLSLKKYLVLDDDYTTFGLRYVKNGKLAHVKITDFDKVCEIFCRYLDISQAKTICFAQGGDYIGGINSGFFWKGLSRKAMNSFFIDVARPIEFLDSINEDVNAYTVYGSRGELFFTATNVYLDQGRTQQNKGGLTDIYLDLGTYIKSFYSVIVMPSAVKVSMMGNRDLRIHHKIDSKYCYPKILSPRYKKKRSGGNEQ